MNERQGKNILFSGVGGQGILLMAELAARTAIHAGFDVKKTEVHGAAQRGGSVVSHVRYSQKVFSPLIPAGEVDILISLEQLEGLRWAHTVRPGGLIVLNSERRMPASIDGKPVDYPEEIGPFLAGRGFTVKILDAESIAVGLGNHRAANIVLLGAIIRETGIPEEEWTGVMKASLPARLLDLNMAALKQGMLIAGEAHAGKPS
jgi:indolepyruvate ferredoxin oxidoreductase beta subunit